VKRYAMALPADDAGRDLQWGLDRLQAEDLWQRSTGTGVTVAVLDTGVKSSHPDLKGRVKPGFDAIANAAGGRKDTNGHGTFIAGMIAGKTGGGGLTGLAPNVRILPVKVLDTEGVGDSDDIARGIIWAADNGADIINMSFGADTPNRVEAEAIDYARGAGVTLIAAGGNEGVALQMYPATYPAVLGVGATDFADAPASFSNRGPHIDVAAPGQGIVGAYTDGKYTWSSGTSMSCAYVSAVAALAMSYSPGAGGEPLAQQIVASARDVGQPGRDRETGAGVIDPAALLQQLGAGRAPGMPADIAATGSPDGTLRLTFTPPANTSVDVRFTKGATAPATPAGKRLLNTTGAGQPLSVEVTGKKPAKPYSFAVFTRGPSGTSRAVAAVRPVTWTLTGSGTVARNSKQKVEVGVRVPEFGWVGGWPLQLTSQRGGLAERTRRFVPSAKGPQTYRVRDLRWSFHYQFSLLAPGFWNTSTPRQSLQVQTSIKRLRKGGISGVVEPNKAASEVQLQRRRGKGWKTIATTQTTPNGRFSFAAKGGTLRVFAPADLWRGSASLPL
jgi:hypothetical protein